MSEGNGLTPKQEKFARLVAEGHSQADAYRGAYNSEKMKSDTIYVKASELMADGRVSGRVEALKAEIAAATVERASITREDLIQKLDAVYVDAMTGDPNGKKAHSAAVQAGMGMAKLLGLDVQKLELSGSVELQHEIAEYKRFRQTMDDLSPAQKARACVAQVVKAHDVPEVQRELVDMIDGLARHLLKSDRRGELLDVFKRHLTEAESWDFTT